MQRRELNAPEAPPVATYYSRLWCKSAVCAHAYRVR